MAETKKTGSAIPWKNLLIFVLLLLLGWLGWQLWQAQEMSKAAKSTQEMLEKQIKEEKIRADRYQKFGEMAQTLCTPSPDSPNTVTAPCVKCLATVSGKSESETQFAIDLGQRLIGQYQKNPDGIEYSDYSRQLEQAASQLLSGDKLRSAKEVEQLEAQIATLTEQNKKFEAMISQDPESRYAMVKADAQKQVDQIKAEAFRALASAKEQVRRAIIERDRARASDSSLQGELQKCLSSSNYLIKRTTLDKPPCWTDEDGALQYLFDVTLLPGNEVIVTPSWPQSRAADAQSIPAVKELSEAFGKPVPLPWFLRHSQTVKNHGEAASPEACRYFVRLKSKIADRVTADRARLAVESVYYKYEKPE